MSAGGKCCGGLTSHRWRNVCSVVTGLGKVLGRLVKPGIDRVFLKKSVFGVFNRHVAALATVFRRLTGLAGCSIFEHMNNFIRNTLTNGNWWRSS